jgi:hypothetical protein
MCCRRHGYSIVLWAAARECIPLHLNICHLDFSSSAPPPPPPNNHRTAVYPEETVLGTENPPGTDLAKGQHIPCFGVACSPLFDLTVPAQPYGRGGGGFTSPWNVLARSQLISEQKAKFLTFKFSEPNQRFLYFIRLQTNYVQQYCRIYR